MNRWFGASAFAAFLALSTPTWAQQFPQHEIHVYCGFPAGSSADVWVRHVAEGLRPLAGKPVIVENKVGASGNLAVEALTHAKPDGHTLAISPGGPLSYNVHLYKRLGYDPVAGLAPIGTVVKFPFVLVVDPKRPVSSVAELVAQLKAKPGDATYGATGGGPIVLSELLKFHAGFNAVQVLYRNTSAIMNDLMAGNLDFVFMDSASALAQIHEGRLKGLAVSTPTRSALAPDIPTMAEAGFPGIDRIAWFGAVLPKETPDSIAGTFNSWMQRILANEETKRFFQTAGAEVFPGPPEQLTALQRDE
ncbi:MAG: tripartite tricarboxylate transporter substrate binding protein, partial [Xanthobacteraceae bacterium]|nr:tripartite tricarboxylate transporter substrate binding protein [Xanthobacteraceae bacterium]